MTTEYLLYLSSPAWMHFALTVKERAGWRCERCGDEGPLEVHHLTYARIGREHFSDVIALCEDCHDAVSPHAPAPVFMQRRLPFVEPESTRH